MKKIIAFAAPILNGKTEEWKKFMNELKTTWAKEYSESRKKLQLHERTFLQTTPQGDFVIVTLEGNDPEKSFMTLTQTNDQFTNWFMTNVKNIHGMDLKELTTLPTLMIDSETLKAPATQTAL